MENNLALRVLQADLFTNTSTAQVLDIAEMFDKLYQEKQQAKANGYS